MKKFISLKEAQFKLYENQTFADYPESAKKNAQKALDWKDKHGDEVKGGTRVGWTRANQIAKGESISRDIVGRIASFERHKKNSKVDSKYKNEPWKDAGHIAYLIWGGQPMIDWAQGIIDKEESINESYKPSLRINNEEWDGDFNIVKFIDKQGGDLGDSHIAYREKILPDVNNGDEVLELHIQVDPDYQRQGYAQEMIKSFLYYHGGTGYISHGRITNPLIHDVIKKISGSGYEVEEWDDYYLIREF